MEEKDGQLNRSEIDKLLGVDQSKRQATLAEYRRICEKVDELKANNEKVNMYEVLKELNLEDVDTFSTEDELKDESPYKETIFFVSANDPEDILSQKEIKELMSNIPVNKGKRATPKEVALVIKALENEKVIDSHAIEVLQSGNFEIWIQENAKDEDILTVTCSPINDSDSNIREYEYTFYVPNFDKQV